MHFFSIVFLNIDINTALFSFKDVSVIFFALPTGILAGSTGIEHTAERLLQDKQNKRKEEMRGLLSDSDSGTGAVVEQPAHLAQCPQCAHQFPIN